MIMPKNIELRQNARRSRENGQAAVFLMLAMGLFLIGGIGFAVDGANLWFHKQSAQNAADAACTAGVMDMLSTASGGVASSSWIGTTFQCSGTTGSTSNNTFPPCRYASFNGYTAASLSANRPGVDVGISFPTNVSGIPACSNTTPPPPMCTAAGVTTPQYIQVNITDRVQTTFIGLLNGGRTVDVGAQAICGVVQRTNPVPILVLNPTLPNTFTVGGNFNLTIKGGPKRSIQVNSADTSAVNFNGGSGTIDLHLANNGAGGDFAVVAPETQPSGPTVNFGTSGQWLDPTGIISDPFASIPAPAKPASDCSASTATCVTYNDTSSSYGCPVAPGNGCDHYTPGWYSQGIAVKKGKDANGNSLGSATGLAVFEPGLYYLDKDFSADSNSCLRPGWAYTGNNTANPALGDGSGGTMFYFAGTNSNPATLQVTSNSGTLTLGPGSGPYFDCASATWAVPTTQVQCILSPNAGWTQLPTGMTALTGNVLLGPCQAPTQGPTAGGYNYGDPRGTNDPLGEQRGMLFFQSRDITLPSNHQPKWGGGGGFGVAGNMYFHDCNSTTSSGTGSGANCNTSTGFTDQFTLGGGSSSNTWVVGDIVVDRLSFGGNPNLNMQLNPNDLYYVLKASLIQ
jgi:hypothetical protein